MKLKDDFFRVTSFCQTEKGFDYIIELNPNHFIFQAHFPENPITPGVCIIQIIKELSTDLLQSKLFFKKIDNIKFLNVINPLENKEISISISFLQEEKGMHKIRAVVYNHLLQFAKLSMSFIPQ